MKCLGLDVGQKRIGIAISESGILARGYKTLIFKDYPSTIGEIITICQKEKIEKIIIGLPKFKSGQENQQTKFVRIFKENLRKKTKIPIVFVNEYLSSREAERLIQQFNDKIGKNRRATRDKIDQMSAIIILEQYINEK